MALYGLMTSKRRVGKASVARMERSVIRDFITACEAAPDFASLHPGYGS
jgi:hypothetical protein